MKESHKKESLYRSRAIYQWKKKGILGATVSRYRKLLDIQNEACAICGIKPKPGDKRLSLDHDSSTGTIRGLLCFRCNYALGVVENLLNANTLDKSLEYLKRPLPFTEEPEPENSPRPYTMERGLEMAERVEELVNSGMAFPRAIEVIAAEEECCTNTIRRYVKLYRSTSSL